MTEERTTETGDVEDVNTVDVERSDADTDVDIQTGGLAVDVEEGGTTGVGILRREVEAEEGGEA